MFVTISYFSGKFIIVLFSSVEVAHPLVFGLETLGETLETRGATWAFAWVRISLRLQDLLASCFAIFCIFISIHDVKWLHNDTKCMMYIYADSSIMIHPSRFGEKCHFLELQGKSLWQRPCSNQVSACIILTTPPPIWNYLNQSIKHIQIYINHHKSTKSNEVTEVTHYINHDMPEQGVESKGIVDGTKITSSRTLHGFLFWFTTSQHILTLSWSFMYLSSFLWSL